MYVYMYPPARASTRRYTHNHTKTHAHTHVQHLCTHTYTPTCTHIHTHIHVHTFFCKDSARFFFSCNLCFWISAWIASSFSLMRFLFLAASSSCVLIFVCSLSRISLNASAAGYADSARENRCAQYLGCLSFVHTWSRSRTGLPWSLPDCGFCCAQRVCLYACTSQSLAKTFAFDAFAFDHDLVFRFRDRHRSTGNSWREFQCPCVI